VDEGIAKDGSVLTTLYALIDIVDNMGGTLGAIFGILLAALATALRNTAHEIHTATEIYSQSLASAVERLKQHTDARVGDRTVMDVLLPFSEKFEESNDFGAAVVVAEEAAESTRNLKPSFGRATYVGEDKASQPLPDPGAWALMEFLKGLYEGTKA
jgi:dihydroxyacetone kinase